METVRRSGKYQGLLVGLLSLNFGVLLFDRNALNFLMPFVQPDLGLNNTEVGLLTSALSFAWAISGFAIGRYSDRTGRRKMVVVVATIAFSLCSFVSGIASSFLMLFGARLLMGFAEGGVLPVSQSMTVIEVDPKHRGMAMGLMQNLGSNLLGSALAPLLIVAVATSFGWRSTFYLAGTPGLIMAVLIFFLLREPPVVQNEEKPAERISIRAALSDRNVQICAILSVLLLSYMILGYTFMPIFLTQMRGLDAHVMGWLMAALGVIGALSCYVVPTISDRIGRRPVLIFCPLLGTVVPLAALYMDHSVVALGVLFSLGWWVMGAFSVFMATVPAESVGAQHTGTVLGIVMGIGEVFGGVLSPVLAGMMADRYGLAAPMWLMCLFCILATLAALNLRETAPRIVNRDGIPPLMPNISKEAS